MARKSKKQNMKKDEDMDVLMNEQVDPVSGNTAPLGAKPEEVRDDIEINVSPNEFVVNAATVRYFGEDFFNELQDTAAEGWERIKEGEELPFRDDELAVSDDAEDKDSFAEGGVVPEPQGGGYGMFGGRGPTFTGFKSETYVNPETGQEIIIFMFKGRPMSRVPKGFVPKSDAPAVEAAKEVAPQQQDDGPAPEADLGFLDSFRNKPVDKWSINDYKDYAAEYGPKANAGKLTTMQKGVLGLVGSVMGGTLGSAGLIRLAEVATNKQAEAITQKTIDLMKSGINPDTGEALSNSDINILNTARINANFIQSNLSKPTSLLGDRLQIPGVGDGVDATDLMQQQQTAISTARTAVEDRVEQGQTLEQARQGSMYDTPLGSTPSTFYGGTAGTEAKLIQSNLTDEEFWEEFEAGTPSGAGATFAETGTGEQQTKTAQEYRDASQTARDNWINATNALNSGQITPDDPAAWNAAMQAQAEASRQATYNAKAAAAVERGDPPPPPPSDDDCVIATHGITTGGFSALEKAKAELWCERTYHGKWYGEVFRKGYRHTGRKAIERGEAEKHYQEFKDFVSFGRGLKKDLKSRLNYYRRTIQFFVTGLFVKD